MKRLLRGFVMAAISLAAAGAFSADKGTGWSEEYDQFKALETRGQKDECLIVAKNCVGIDDSVMQRVERLTREIEKGAATYTPEELQMLRNQLNWIYTESSEFSPARI